MVSRIIIVSICGVIIAGTSIFGLFYDPGHPWMDKKRKIGVTVVCICGAIQMLTVLLTRGA